MGNLLGLSLPKCKTVQHRGLLDSGYSGNLQSSVERYVPPRPVGLGTHELSAGSAHSHITVKPCGPLHWRQDTHCPIKAGVRRYACLGTWALSAAIVLTLGLTLRFVIMATINDIELSVGDQLIITSRLSPLFCRNLQLTSSQKFSAHRLDDGNAPRNFTHVGYALFYPDWHVDGGTYIHHNFRLIAGSTLSMSICATCTRIEMFIVQSEQRWHTERYCPDCNVILYSPIYQTHGECNNTDQVFNVIINKTANYMILFDNPWAADHQNTAWITLRVVMNRTVYTTLGEPGCEPGTRCVLPLSTLSQQAVMVEFLSCAKAPDCGTMLDQSEELAYISAGCEAREFTYLFVFLVLPLGLALSIIVLMQFYHQRNMLPFDSLDKDYAMSFSPELAQRRVEGRSEDIASVAYVATQSDSAEIPDSLLHHM